MRKYNAPVIEFIQLRVEEKFAATAGSGCTRPGSCTTPAEVEALKMQGFDANLYG